MKSIPTHRFRKSRLLRELKVWRHAPVARGASLGPGPCPWRPGTRGASPGALTTLASSGGPSWPAGKRSVAVAKTSFSRVVGGHRPRGALLWMASPEPRFSGSSLPGVGTPCQTGSLIGSIRTPGLSTPLGSTARLAARNAMAMVTTPSYPRGGVTPSTTEDPPP